VETKFYWHITNNVKNGSIVDLDPNEYAAQQEMQFCERTDKEQAHV
jgi:hypothetical protein